MYMRMKDFLVLATVAHSGAKVPIRCKAKTTNDAIAIALQYCQQNGYDIVNVECVWLSAEIVYI